MDIMESRVERNEWIWCKFSPLVPLLSLFFVSSCFYNIVYPEKVYCDNYMCGC